MMENKMTEQEQKDIDSFAARDLNDIQLSKINSLNNAASHLCRLIVDFVPNCADRSAAIRYLRLAIMQANAAITHN
jgi:hypothetical protein